MISKYLVCCIACVFVFICCVLNIVAEPKYDTIKFYVYDYDKYTVNDFLGEANLPVLAVVNCGAEVEYDDW